jgi:methionine biosynthesis protein MetW
MIYDTWYRSIGSRKAGTLTRQQQEVLRLLPAADGQRVLEIGCSNGNLAAAMAERGLDVVGIDIAQDAVNDCRRRGLRAEWVDVEKGINLGQFGVVVATEVIEHLFDPWHFVREINRSLHLRGLAILSAPNFSYWRHLPRYLRGQSPWKLQSPLHLRFFTHEDLRALVERQGFEVLRLYGLCRWRWVPDGVTRRWARNLMAVLRKVDAPQFVNLAQRKGWQ